MRLPTKKQSGGGARRRSERNNLRRDFAFVMRSFPSLFLFFVACHAATADVQIVQRDGHFELLHNGETYFVKGGGGGENALESLAMAGGNSIRLWGDQRLGDVLDRAQKLGL